MPKAASDLKKKLKIFVLKVLLFCSLKCKILWRKVCKTPSRRISVPIIYPHISVRTHEKLLVMTRDLMGGKVGFHCPCFA